MINFNSAKKYKVTIDSIALMESTVFPFVINVHTLYKCIHRDRQTYKRLMFLIFLKGTSGNSTFETVKLKNCIQSEISSKRMTQTWDDINQITIDSRD